MEYILNKNIALRSFMLVPYAYYIKGSQFAKGLDKVKFYILLLCDGKTDIEDNEIIQDLLKENLISVAKEGDELTDWQKHKICENRYMPRMNLEITERCNYNCLHCFNAIDATPLKNELTFDEINKILDDARDCGVNALTITGGEPMIHKDFMNIVKSIYSHGMYVFELNTNGYFLTQNVLDEFKALGCHPLMKISFDGLGFHDIMRDRKGAEEDAIRAIKLCIENGFEVMVQMQINQLNKDIILKSLEFCDSLGVLQTRVIRTSEAPRFKKIAEGKIFGWKEYYEEILKISDEYLKNEHNMSIDFWSALLINPKNKSFFITATRGEYRDTLPYCEGARGMIAISASGRVYPCMQVSGYYNEHGIELENVKKVGLKSILKESKFLEMVCKIVKNRYEHNEKCRKCKYWKMCAGGCSALAIGYTGNYDGVDASKCIFFENGFYEKYVDFFSKKWHNV